MSKNACRLSNLGSQSGICTKFSFLHLVTGKTVQLANVIYAHILVRGHPTFRFLAALFSGLSTPPFQDWETSGPLGISGGRPGSVWSCLSSSTTTTVTIRIFKRVFPHHLSRCPLLRITQGAKMDILIYHVQHLIPPPPPQAKQEGTMSWTPFRAPLSSPMDPGPDSNTSQSQNGKGRREHNGAFFLSDKERGPRSEPIKLQVESLALKPFTWRPTTLGAAPKDKRTKDEHRSHVY